MQGTVAQQQWKMVEPKAVHKILVVDDDPDILDTMSDLVRLGIDGAVVRTATSGEEALQLLQRNGWTAVVTDYRMPGMNGAQLADQVRRVRPRVRVMMVTAFDDRQVDADARDSGISIILHKPFDVEEFIQAVSKLIRA